MKRLLALLTVFLVALTIRAGIFNQRDAAGIVYYCDGHQETFQTISIPYAGDKKFKGVDASGQKRTVKAVDVDHLELWHPKNPEESRDELWCCCDTKPDGSKKFLAWCFGVGLGKHIRFFTHEGKYIMQKSGLAMVIRSNSVGPVLICVKPTVSGIYERVGLMSVLEFASKKMVRFLVERFIYDDPTLCKSIQEKNWKGKVYELLDFVAGTYCPQQK